MRIQPFEIEVPADDPFEQDLLDRKESVEVLTHLVRSLEGPCVLAVDAAWGNGKTTFLKIWRQYLLNLGFPVVQFNAWETDFAGDPFLASSTELTDGLKEYADSDAKIEYLALCCVRISLESYGHVRFFLRIRKNKGESFIVEYERLKNYGGFLIYDFWPLQIGRAFSFQLDGT